MADGGLLGGIMNPAQADVLGAMDKGKKRQALEMAGEIMGQTQYGQLGALYRTDVELGDKVANALGIPKGAKGRIDAMKGAYTLANQFAQAGDNETAAAVMDDYVSMIQGSSQGQEMAAIAQRGSAALRNGDPEAKQNLNAIVGSFSATPPKYSQGGKGMEGFAFNENDGSFTLHPKTKAALDSDAGRLATKDMLDAKDVNGVNNNVTALIKDAVGINKAASDLVALETSGTTSDQIAAVFKFMKAMDPSSTVRESELGMVYNAEGAAQGFANYVNSLVQGKKIDPEGFKKIVNTAKTLSNSAVQASQSEVESYTNVIVDNLTGKQVKALRARVPGLYEIPKETIKVDY